MYMLLSLHFRPPKVNINNWFFIIFSKPFLAVSSSGDRGSFVSAGQQSDLSDLMCRICQQELSYYNRFHQEYLCEACSSFLLSTSRGSSPSYPF